MTGIRKMKQYGITISKSRSMKNTHISLVDKAMVIKSTCLANHSILQSLLRETEALEDYAKQVTNKQNVTCFFWLLVWLTL
jgi:hypothetical protein